MGVVGLVYIVGMDGTARGDEVAGLQVERARSCQGESLMQVDLVTWGGDIIAQHVLDLLICPDSFLFIQ